MGLLAVPKLNLVNPSMERLMALYLADTTVMLLPSLAKKAARTGRLISGMEAWQLWTGSPGRLKVMVPDQGCATAPVGVAETSEESVLLPPAFKACTL